VSTILRRRLEIAAFVAVMLFALLQQCQLGYSDLRLNHERHLRVVSDIHAVDCQVESFRAAHGNFPATPSVLQHTVSDPWSHQYVYRLPGRHRHDTYDLFSAGPDGKPDTPDDD
jgi:hypothetical protein